MKKIQITITLLGCVLGLLSGRAVAAGGATDRGAEVTMPPGRFLFIVETSKAMKQELPAAAQSLQQLLMSGLEGQLREGDTVGLWTFDSELHAGVFPLQLWSDQKRQMVAELAAEFVREQKTKGKARPEQFVPEMLRLVEGSEALTVLIYSTGSQPIQGTPFDETINEVFRQHGEELKGARIPFVTVLVGRKGRVVKCAVNSASGVDLPLLPQEDVPPPQPVKPAGPTPLSKVAPFSQQTPSVRPAPARVNPSIIVDYSQSNLVKSATVERVAPDKMGIKVMPATVLLETTPEKGNPPAVVEEAPALMVVRPANVSEASSVTEAVPPPIKVYTQPVAVAAPAATVAAASLPPPAAGNDGSSGKLGIIAAALVAVLFAGAGFYIGTRRNGSRRKGGSLITESFDQRKR